jgi:predicted nucleic acid-binding protein
VIAVDTNILVDAHRADSPFHDRDAAVGAMVRSSYHADQQAHAAGVGAGASGP